MLKARERRAWTQRDLAREAGIAKRTVNRLERGRPVHLQTVRLVSEALGVSVADLALDPTPTRGADRWPRWRAVTAAGAGGGLLVAALALGAAMGNRNVPPGSVFVTELDGARVRAVDSDGSVRGAWSLARVAEVATEVRDGCRPAQDELADAVGRAVSFGDGQGRALLLLGLHRSARLGAQHVALDSRGEVAYELAALLATDQVATRRRALTRGFLAGPMSEVVHLPDREGPRLLVSYTHAELFPLEIVLADATTGRREGSWWHPGHVYSWLVIPGERCPRLVLGLTNNAFDEAAVAVLRLDELRGQPPMPGREQVLMDGVPVVEPEAYWRLSRAWTTRQRNEVVGLEWIAGRILARIAEHVPGEPLSGEDHVWLDPVEPGRCSFVASEAVMAAQLDWWKREHEREVSAAEVWLHLARAHVLAADGSGWTEVACTGG